MHHFPLGNHMKLSGKFGMGGEGRCRTVHYWSQYIAKNISGVHSFLRLRIDTFPKTSPMEMKLSKCPAKEKRGKKSKRSIKEMQQKMKVERPVSF